MHYYKRNIGDYHKKAGRLSILQHGVYTLLIDACYDRERFPTLEEAIDWTWALSDEEKQAVEFVLRKFFTLQDGVYVQGEIMEDIEAYQENSKTNKRIAIEREEKRRAANNEASTKRAQGVNEAPPNQEPLTNNQEPDKDYTQKPAVPACPVEQIIQLYRDTARRLPSVRIVPDSVKAHIRARWLQDKRFQSLEFWRGFFEYCENNKFLSGQSETRGDRKPFRASLAWVVNATNFAKIINEDYA